MRHGEAASHASSDEQRPLTKRGLVQVESIAQQLKPTTFDYVFVSPFLRAQQTWEMLSKFVKTNQVDTVNWCTPDISTAPALDALVRLPANKTILVVCHQTFAGRLATQLTQGNEQGMHFTTAQVIQLQAEVLASPCAHLKHTFLP
ncbi:phosphohistidine phosphatase SixA [Bermanella sp. R86510]|uniref:phosphohistidine phosphatase SixA n=1 Tax=unclassified Bermanella TaxID=2627862 RepID=UPI0037CC35D1